MPTVNIRQLIDGANEVIIKPIEDNIAPVMQTRRQPHRSQAVLAIGPEKYSFFNHLVVSSSSTIY